MVEVGTLCRPCAADVMPVDGLIPDHVRSTVPPTEAEAWVVDGFGAAHALAERSTIGRSHDGQIVLLASSVSREHVELRATSAGWVARDLGSRNGTLVDGVRCHGRAALPQRALLKVGDVALWFLAEVAGEPALPPAIETVTAGGVLRYNLTAPHAELCLVGAADASTAGSLLSRSSATAAWAERALPPLEFQLLRTICGRAIEEAGLPSAVRGCVATKQLVRDLPWQSKYANEENVRQLVRRLRENLTSAGGDGILAVAPGRGYYLTCPVTIGGPDRR